MTPMMLPLHFQPLHFILEHTMSACGSDLIHFKYLQAKKNAGCFGIQ